MKIAYISDIHYDIYRTFDTGILYESQWDVLVIAGDTGHPHQLMELCEELSRDFPNSHLIVTTGNHEYYHTGCTVKECDQSLLDWSSELDNVHVLLYGDLINLRGINFIGATLWTDFGFRISPHIEMTSRMAAFSQINDFSFICKDEGAIGVIDMREYHERDRNGIINSLQKVDDLQKTVVVTHFSPTALYGNNAFPHGPLSYYFSATMDDVIEHFQPKIWISGHTHSDRDIMMCGDTELRSNQNHVGGRHKLKYFDI